MKKWVKEMKKQLNDWRDLAYNTFNASRDYFSYDECTWMPIIGLLDWINYLSPKLKAELKKQEADRLRQELTGKRQRNHTNPKIKQR